jgi:CubicO group peptidase (beta-lactamase class C family)
MGKIVAGVVIALIVLAGALYGLAYLTTSRSGLSRSIIWMDADVFDYKRFPARSMEASDDPLVLNRASPDGSLFDAAVPGGNLESFLAQTQTAAFIAIRDDEVIYEDYFNGYDEDSTVTSFSVAKSYIATLIGIALDRGFINSVDDPVTRYIPELLERDQEFRQITLRHLLTMSSGLRWNEQGLPWSDDAETYYGTNLRRLAMQDTEIVAPPGESFVYNPYNTLLLGLVLERATEQQVSEFMEDEVWRPMGAVADGTWSLDSDTNGFEKMESGLNSRAIDMVKLGLVYLHGGELNGNRIITDDWAREATDFTNANDPSTEYQYQWWTYTDPELGDWFGAQGNKGQFIAVFPRKDLVIARFGLDFGYDDWPALLATMARTLPGRRTFAD